MHSPPLGPSPSSGIHSSTGEPTPIGTAATWLVVATCFVVSVDLAVNPFASQSTAGLLQIVSAAVAFGLVAYLVLTGAPTFGGGRGTAQSPRGVSSMGDDAADFVIDLRDPSGAMKPLSEPVVRHHSSVR